VLQIWRIVGQILRFWCQVPNFVWLAKGLLTGMRSIAVTLALMSCAVFVFAIIFIKLGTPSSEDCFDTVLLAMHCLMKQGIFADQMDMISDLFNVNLTAYFTFIIYLLVANLGFLNLFVGVFVDIVNKVSDQEEKSRREQEASEITMRMLEEIDQDEDQCISIYEFRDLCESETAYDKMVTLEVDVQDLWDLGPFIFFDKDEISLQEFQKHIMQLRGSNPVTVKDIVDTRKFVLEELEKRMQSRERTGAGSWCEE